MTAYNPGKIIEIDNWLKWKTRVDSFELTLDIIPIDCNEDEETGIASFVAMEQEQPFLDFAGSLLAKSIADKTTGKNVLLVTVESKGSHFIPWVWKNLEEITGGKLSRRALTLRKGNPKVYMKRPACFQNSEIAVSSVKFQSITSPDKQTLTISPKDLEHLLESANQDIEPVFIDDFIGTGGTIAAVHKLFQQIKLKPPCLTAAIGSDGEMYKQTLAGEGIENTIIPQPFPLILPTFIRKKAGSSWKTRF